jgi:hypothetical protein
LTAVTHTIIVLALVAAYTAITITHGDGTPLLGVMAGYIGAAGITAITEHPPKNEG